MLVLGSVSSTTPYSSKIAPFRSSVPPPTSDNAIWGDVAIFASNMWKATKTMVGKDVKMFEIVEK